MIACADCGCVVERGVIVKPCDRHPQCRCAELPVVKVRGTLAS